MAMDAQLLKRCRKLMDESQAVCLATVEGAAPKLRALWNLRRQDRFPSAAEFCRKQGLVAYFATSVSSAKVRDIRANPAVSLYYCDADNVRGVMLTGRGEILTDAGLKRALWHDSWSIYWAGGAADPDYCVLRVTPQEAVGWWGTSPFRIEAAGP
jgi:general stress protein 26